MAYIPAEWRAANHASRGNLSEFLDRHAIVRFF